MRGWLMLLATLTAFVTYQVGLNLLGGFWQSDGTPWSSTSVVIIDRHFLMNKFYHSEAKVEALEIILMLDMAALMGAYIAGSTHEVSLTSHHKASHNKSLTSHHKASHNKFSRHNRFQHR
ncbi:hypothetical protein PR202_ga17170 [Eleusine coracana subsp. coracana]|uniref:PGG domain-containing protein n=1 Tax=Eleusine coracana subsp. coracana TaxID=191504 RepID=A0AAV5CQ15_ELECO|nr:hypothetical protein PR202_ga17170 [Eleusine coracana subsp. coracana]